MTLLPKSTFGMDVNGKVLLQLFLQKQVKKGNQNVSSAKIFSLVKLHRLG